MFIQSKMFGWGKTIATGNTSASNAKGQGNASSELIPGYVVPMSLASSALLDVYKNKKKRVGSVALPPIQMRSFSNINFKQPKPVSSINSDTNAGDGWFGMESAQNTAEIQADILAILRKRNYSKAHKRRRSNKRALLERRR